MEVAVLGRSMFIMSCFISLMHEAIPISTIGNVSWGSGWSGLDFPGPGPGPG